MLFYIAKLIYLLNYFYRNPLTVEFLDHFFDGCKVFAADVQFRKTDFRNFQFLHVFHFYFVDNHTDCTGIVGNRIDQDKSACIFVFRIRIEK